VAELRREIQCFERRDDEIEMSGFALHERLANDTVAVCALSLCVVRLMNDCRFAWAVLVPQRVGVTEITDLSAADRRTLIDEIALVSAALQKLALAEKMNVGALGNIVRQLHVHIIARHEGDEAWPGPVWGHGLREPYAAGEAEACAAEMRKALGM
jgi:diadenosine tetraphosphate (Ap4A) HIT family hydrolase